MHLFRGLRGYCYLRSGSRSLQHFSLRHNAFNWHGFRDRGPLDLCFCHHKAYDVSTRGLQLLHGVDDITAVYVPFTMVTADSVASTPGATVSA
jgi:hypothetical protein